MAYLISDLIELKNALELGKCLPGYANLIWLEIHEKFAKYNHGYICDGISRDNLTMLVLI